jgi:predicted nucleic acid-binding protein
LLCDAAECSLNRYIETILELEPFRVERLGGQVFEQALEQVKRRGASSCKSLDRLHLAAMQTLGLTSILTKDRRQGAVAKSLGFTVIG